MENDNTDDENCLFFTATQLFFSVFFIRKKGVNVFRKKNQTHIHKKLSMQKNDNIVGHPEIEPISWLALGSTQ